MDAPKILYYYWYYKYHLKFNNRSQLETWQENKIREFINAVLPRSPFYREYAQKNLTELPIVNKRIMMENFDSLNTVNIKKDDAFVVAFNAEETRDFKPTINNIIVGLSSGTSGNRGLFLIDPTEKVKWIGMALAKVLNKSIFSKYKIAFFMRANSNLYSSIGNNSRIQFKFFDLLKNFDENMCELNIFKPDILISPARALRFIAEEQFHKRIAIYPSKIISVADVLDPADEKFIKNSFQQIVHQVYQCTEGFLAVTCDKGVLHLNEDVVHIEKEWIDVEQRRFVPIITDFTRNAQPIIRYRLDDILVASKTSCDCGSPHMSIEKIEGRCDDVLYCIDQATQKLKPIFADFIRRALLTASDQIKEYKVTQHAPLELEITYYPYHNSEIEANIRNTLSALASEKQFILPNIIFKEYQKKPLHEKVRRVERNFAI